MFKVGDKAVYPAHGVGIIEGVEEKDIGNTVHTFFMLRIIDNDIIIMVPTNIPEVGTSAGIAAAMQAGTGGLKVPKNKGTDK